jgi:hypothetical protein
MKKPGIVLLLLILGIILYLSILFIFLSKAFPKRNEQTHSEKRQPNYSLRV